jgi:hypothetical protein
LKRKEEILKIVNPTIVTKNQKKKNLKIMLDEYFEKKSINETFGMD